MHMRAGGALGCEGCLRSGCCWCWWCCICESSLSELLILLTNQSNSLLYNSIERESRELAAFFISRGVVRASPPTLMALSRNVFSILLAVQPNRSATMLREALREDSESLRRAESDSSSTSFAASFAPSAKTTLPRWRTAAKTLNISNCSLIWALVTQHNTTQHRQGSNDHIP